MSFYEMRDFSELIIWLTRQSSNRSCWSYAALARKLNIRSPRTLGMVAKGQRAPSFLLVKKIAEYLEATPQQKDFLLLLAEKSRCLVKKSSIDAVEEKLQQYRQMKTILWDGSSSIAGVKIEFESHVDKGVRRKLEETLRYLVIEIQKSESIRK